MLTESTAAIPRGKRKIVNTNIRLLLVSAAVIVAPTLRATNIDSLFASTDDAGLSAWFVSTNVSGIDTGTSDARFLVADSDFQPAVRYVGRGDFISNVSNGTNGWVGRYTQFVFRQHFDLTGYDPASAVLQFTWAADDSGEGFADRGGWTPKFKLNGGAYQPYPGTNTYSLGAISTVSTGFVAGINQIDFFVQGNGMTDGFALNRVSFTARPLPTGVPDAASSAVLTLIGCVTIAGLRRRGRDTDAAPSA